MMQTPDPDQMRRDALMQQMGPNQTQPVGQPVKLDYSKPASNIYDTINAIGTDPNYVNNVLDYQKANNVQKPHAMAAGSAGSVATGGANGPEARNALGGYAGVGQMNGFNTSGYGGDMKAANSVKNTFGRIASRYDHAPGSIDQIMADPDFQRYFSGAKRVEGGAGDKIDFGGVLSDFESGVPVGIVDVLQGADPNSNSSQGWQWLDEANAPGAQPQQDLSALLGLSQPQQPQGNNLDEVMAQIQALSQGQDDPMQREALMHLLNPQGMI